MATARVAEANRELVVRNLTSPGDNERDARRPARPDRRVPAAAGQRVPRLRLPGQPAGAGQTRRDRRRRPRGGGDRRRGRAHRSASPTWSSSPASARRSRRRSWARSSAASRSWRPSVVTAPVRLVKTIGDAVMLVSPEAGPLVGDGARPGRRGGRRRRPVPDPAGRDRDRADAAAVGRLLRPLGQPGEPGHRHRPSRQRPRRHPDPRGGRRGRLRPTRSPASAA